MKIYRLFLILSFIILTLTLSACNLNLIRSATPPDDSNLMALSTPTPTSTLIGRLQLSGEEPVKTLRGELEIRFPDPWGKLEFCSSKIPYEMVLEEKDYQLKGQGQFDCLQSETYEGGVIQYLEQHYEVILTGKMPALLGSILTMDLQLIGAQDGYFDMPPEVPEMITSTNPFHLEIDQQLMLRFLDKEESNCLWNNEGVFCSIDEDQQALGESGWLFILYPND